jgi:hypothetical protein
MQLLKVKLNGTSSLLMHSDRMANPLDTMAKQLRLVSKKRIKTDEDYEEMSKIEWYGGVYYDEKQGPYLPGRNIKKCLIKAASKSKQGQKIKGGVDVVNGILPLKYDGPRTLDGLWNTGKFVDIRTVGVKTSRVSRTRPVFDEWSVTVVLSYDPAQIDKQDLLEILETGGRIIGLGDYRKELGGDFGQFEVQEVK